MHPTEEISMPPGILAQLCPLLAELHSNYEIAQLLNVSEAQVQDYLGWLMQAFGVSTRVELLVYFCGVRGVSEASHASATTVKQIL
jgi:hypothetical protein